MAVVPVLLYSFVGIELPASAAEEMTDAPRDLPPAIARAGVSQLTMYAIPILAVLVVLPPRQISSLHGLIDALRAVLTVYGGRIGASGDVTLTGAGAVVGLACAALFVWVLLASGAAWIMGAGRAQAAACLDGAGPRALGRVSEATGVPVIMAVVSGLASLATMGAYLAVTSGDGQRYFSAALTVAISLILLAYLAIFPAFVALRRRRPALDRPFRVPGGMGVACLLTVLATGWSLVALVCLLWPGIGTAHPDVALPAGFAGARARYEELVIGPVAAVVAVYVAYALALAWRRVPAGEGPLEPSGAGP